VNILQVVSNLEKGDAGLDVIDSTRFLTLNGHKVVVFSEKSPHVKDIDEVGARFYPFPARAHFWIMPAILFRFFKIARRENIEIIHSRDTLSAFLSFFVSRCTDRPFLSTIYRQGKMRLFSRPQFWAKNVICFTDSEAQYVIKNNMVPRNKIKIIPPFVKKSLSQVKKESILKGFILGVALPISVHHKAENAVRTISFLSRNIHKLKVFIADSSDSTKPDDIEKLKLLIRRHSLKNVVTFSETEFLKRLSEGGFHLYFQINPEETFSTRFLLRAEANGIPIIAEDASWINSYVEDGKTAVILGDKSPQSTAEAIYRLYKDETLLKRMAEEGKNFTRNNFNIEKVMNNTLEVYKESLVKKHILIIKIAALGDVILATPSLRAIRGKFPASRIKILVDIKYREIFLHSPYIDDIIVCDLKGRDKGITGLLRLAKKLRSENFDIIVDLQNNKKSHLLAFLSCASRRFGYDNGKLSFLMNRKVKDSKTPMDPVKHQMRLLSTLGIVNADSHLELWPTKEDDEWAENYLKSHWVKKEDKLLALSLGSSPRWLTKLWPIENFISLSNKLASEKGIRVILIGSLADDERTKAFLSRVRCKPINALGKTSIPRLASLIKRCSLLLSSDSAPIHVAASQDVPFVALFGPTDPRRHLPPAKVEHAVIKKDLPCQPCYHSYCDRGYVCMRSIDPLEVYEKILKLLKIK